LRGGGGCVWEALPEHKVFTKAVFGTGPIHFSRVGGDDCTRRRRRRRRTIFTILQREQLACGDCDVTRLTHLVPNRTSTR
jgi:hypothetical protein